jgi:hypothetical protein
VIVLIPSYFSVGDGVQESSEVVSCEEKSASVKIRFYVYYLECVIQWFEVLVSVLRSVARSWLVETGNPSVWAMMIMM